jgi:predicted membrane protein
MTRNLGARFGLGLFLVLVGALVLVELFADVHLPIFRLVVAIGIVIIGGRMILQTWNRRGVDRTAGEAVFANLDFSHRGALERDERFDVVLGRGTIDLTRIAEPVQDVTITVDTLLGRALIKLPPELAYDVEGSATFGQLRMPDGSAIATGELAYRAPNDRRSRLHLRMHTVLGMCQLVEASVPAALPAPQ